MVNWLQVMWYGCKQPHQLQTWQSGEPGKPPLPVSRTLTVIIRIASEWESVTLHSVPAQVRPAARHASTNAVTWAAHPVSRGSSPRSPIGCMCLWGASFGAFALEFSTDSSLGTGPQCGL